MHLCRGVVSLVSDLAQYFLDVCPVTLIEDFCSCSPVMVGIRQESCCFCQCMGPRYDGDADDLPALWDVDWAGGLLCYACYEREEPPHVLYLSKVFKIDKLIADAIAQYTSQVYADWLRRLAWMNTLPP